MTDGEDIIRSQNFLLQLYHKCFLIFSRSGSWFPFLLFHTKLLGLLNSTTVSIHNLFRLSHNKVVSKAQIHEMFRSVIPVTYSPCNFLSFFFFFREEKLLNKIQTATYVHKSMSKNLNRKNGSSSADWLQSDTEILRFRM